MTPYVTALREYIEAERAVALMGGEENASQDALDRLNEASEVLDLTPEEGLDYDLEVGDLDPEDFQQQCLADFVGGVP